MTKDLKQYPVTFGYGRVDGVNYFNLPGYGLGMKHHGDDRACPVGTPIKVSSKLIGYTGNTGLSSGPHCHTDKRRKTISGQTKWLDPKGWSNIHGTVTFAGDAGSAGLMVEITTALGTRYRFLHLSKLSKKVGDKI